MGLIYADRVKENSATTGTGSMTLGGALTGFQAFSDAMADEDICYYTITDGTDWEVGLGSYEATGGLLERTTVLASSNSNSEVNWSGATELFITHPASVITNTAITTNPLSQFAATTSAQLRGVLSDETGTGALVFGTSPAITTPTGIVKADVGLGNVDNTTDAGKPVSTAQAAANTTDRARANHTGTQLASTISNFATQVRATVLTGISFASSATITAVDSVLSALGKLQAQVTLNNAKVTNATHTGDVTGATALTIGAGAVTLAKQANVATGTVFYRKTAGTGAPEVQTLATLKTDLGLTGTNSGDQTLPVISDTAYDATSWNANTDGATKNAIRDQIEVVDAKFDGKPTIIRFPAHVFFSVVANTTTETDLHTAKVIPANSILAEDIINVASSGSITNNSGGDVEYTLRLYVDTLVLLEWVFTISDGDSGSFGVFSTITCIEYFGLRLAGGAQLSVSNTSGGNDTVVVTKITNTGTNAFTTDTDWKWTLEMDTADADAQGNMLVATLSITTSA